LPAAQKQFESKFKDKTKNNWADRGNFVSHPGKYTIVEIDHSTDEPDAPLAKVVKSDGKIAKVLPCTLDKPTMDLIKLIFDHDMFNNSMKEMEIDTEKMPLGKLTKAQVQRGYDVLQDLKSAISGRGSTKDINELTSKFYTLIPHSFGRKVPPPINTAEGLQRKVDLLNTLGDIEVAQSLLKSLKPEQDTDAEIPHEFDRNYALLGNELRLIDKQSDEFKIIEKYCRATQGGYFKGHILEVWSMDRKGERERVAKYKDIANRKLLWHGTSVAVMVAILSGGLRIMPHSGGRVGKGIYHASEQSKSAGYTRPANGVGLMFLNEVILGKQNEILQDDSSLAKAPKGYDSVLAVGRVEPDPSKDITIPGEHGPVIVPQAAPIKTRGAENSSFSQSEYLVYDEAQVRMRYVLKMKW